MPKSSEKQLVAAWGSGRKGGIWELRGSASACSGPPGQYPTPVPQVKLTTSDTPFRIEHMIRSPGPVAWEGLVPAPGQPTHPTLPGADPVVVLEVPYPRSPLSPRRAGMVSHALCRLSAQTVWVLPAAKSWLFPSPPRQVGDWPAGSSCQSRPRAPLTWSSASSPVLGGPSIFGGFLFYR